jgi:hypothetical protein
MARSRSNRNLSQAQFPTNESRWANVHPEPGTDGGMSFQEHAHMSALDNADLGAREEGHERYSERWFGDALSSYYGALDDGPNR